MGETTVTGFMAVGVGTGTVGSAELIEVAVGIGVGSIGVRKSHAKAESIAVNRSIRMLTCCTTGALGKVLLGSFMIVMIPSYLY